LGDIDDDDDDDNKDASNFSQWHEANHPPNQERGASEAPLLGSSNVASSRGQPPG